MNNYILINKTYSEATPQSSEVGDFSETGLIVQDEKLTFSELVRLMKEHTQASCSPDDLSTNTWYSTGFFTSDYGKGIEREECIHYSSNNTVNAAKYWKYARIAANKKLK